MSSEGSIHITSITLNVRRKCCKTMHHITLQTQAGKFKREIAGQLSPGGEYSEVFDNPVELSARDKLTISMQYQIRHLGIEGTRHITIAIKQSEIAKEARENAQGNKSYMKLKEKIVITIGISCNLACNEEADTGEHGSSTVEGSQDSDSLLPTTSEILSVCPRFRLLIIGNTGVGKSSLIRNVFGIQDVNVSESSRGKAEIDREFVATGNERFVLHDSLGLEAGEGENLAKVKKFIHDRRQKQDLKERLHAVWVCLPVPYAKGRLLEAGMEEFLRDRQDILGDIPIVVVLTKLDLLDNTLMSTMLTQGAMFKSIHAAKPLLEPRRAEYLEEYCAQPLERVAGNDVPHIAVSTIGGYTLEPTIPELVKKTTSEIERYIRADPSYGVVSEQSRIERNAPLYMAGMAQRVSIEGKVDLTIATGKKKYWANLSACLTFSSESVKRRLLVIHRDIIQVWNFDDPEMALQDNSFSEALLDTSNLGVGAIPGGKAVLESVAPIASALVALVCDLTTAVVALPVAGAITLATFCREAYKSAKIIAKRFIAYITDLIYVMKILFVLALQGPVTRRDVALALDVYTKSMYREDIHQEINRFSARFVVFPGGRDMVLEKIEALIRRHNITDEEVSRLRSQIHVSPDALQNAEASF